MLYSCVRFHFIDICSSMSYFCCVFFLMIRRPPRSTRTDTLFPYTKLVRSTVEEKRGVGVTEVEALHDLVQARFNLPTWCDFCGRFVREILGKQEIGRAHV